VFTDSEVHVANKRRIPAEEAKRTGTWTATPTGGDSGSFGFGPLAVTKAFCPPPSLDGQIARHAEYLRSYVLRDGRLYLNLMADGGTYVWEPHR